MAKDACYKKVKARYKVSQNVEKWVPLTGVTNLKRKNNERKKI